MTENEAPARRVPGAREPEVEIGVALDEDRAAHGGSIRRLRPRVLS
jgi:hypothetical protein